MLLFLSFLTFFFNTFEMVVPFEPSLNPSLMCIIRGLKVLKFFTKTLPKFYEYQDTTSEKLAISSSKICTFYFILFHIRVIMSILLAHYSKIVTSGSRFHFPRTNINSLYSISPILFRMTKENLHKFFSPCLLILKLFII